MIERFEGSTSSCSVSRGEIAKRRRRASKPHRKAKRHTGAYFIDRLSVRQGMTKSYVEGQVVANLPYRADEPGYRERADIFLAERLPVKDFRDGAHRPRCRSLQDHVDEQFEMMMPRMRCFSVEVDGAPLEALRYDSGHAHAKPRMLVDPGQQCLDFGGDARPALILEACA